MLIILAFVGNLLVCVAICWERQLRRQRDNLFLVSLAVSDLLVSVLVMVFAAANDLQNHWAFGQLYCKLWISFDIMCCTCSILNLCAVALDRYWHISRPMVYVRYMNRKRIGLIIAFVWTLSTLIGFAQLTFEETGSSPHADGEICALQLKPFYAIVSSTLSFFLPATVMVLLYTRLYLYARKHVKTMRSQMAAVCTSSLLKSHCEQMRSLSVHTASPTRSDGGGTTTPTGLERRETRTASVGGDTALIVDKLNSVSANRSRCAASPARASLSVVPRPLTPPAEMNGPSGIKQQKLSQAKQSTVMKSANNQVHVERQAASEQKARVTLGVIMGTFLLCWVPFFVVNVLKPFLGDSVSKGLFQAVTWLGYANSTANPIIYSIFNRDFRRAFHRVLTYCCLRRRRSDGDLYGGAGGGGNHGGTGGHGGGSSAAYRSDAVVTANEAMIAKSAAGSPQQGRRRSQSLREPVETKLVIQRTPDGRLTDHVATVRVPSASESPKLHPHAHRNNNVTMAPLSSVTEL